MSQQANSMSMRGRRQPMLFIALTKAGRPVRLLPNKTPFRDVCPAAQCRGLARFGRFNHPTCARRQGYGCGQRVTRCGQFRNPGTPLKVRPLIAIFNDACGGIDGAGYSRLPALDLFATPAATIAGMSAKINDARSSLETGIISRVNSTARSAGITVGSRLRDLLETPSICDQLAKLAE